MSRNKFTISSAAFEKALDTLRKYFLMKTEFQIENHHGINDIQFQSLII